MVAGVASPLVLLIIALLASCSTGLLQPDTVSIPMSDGTTLLGDLYLPSSTRRWPLVLIQTPYGRSWFQTSLPLGVGTAISSSPYAFLITDWRCFYGSASACTKVYDRGQDGAAIVTWAAAQSWSNGNVALYGQSALGRIQFLTAQHQPPALQCMIPVVADPLESYLTYFPGGAARVEYIDTISGLGLTSSSSLYSHPYNSSYWDKLQLINWNPASTSVPTLLIAGWYDHNLPTMLQVFNSLQTNSAAISTPSRNWLLLGPWGHRTVGNLHVGQLQYPAARGVDDDVANEFLSWCLLNTSNAVLSRPQVTVYDLGAGKWLQTSSWPLHTQQQLFYLSGNKEMTASPPGVAMNRTFTYDPSNPSPTVGGATLSPSLSEGPYDQAATTEARSDVLTWDTPPVNSTLHIAGSISMTLFVATSVVDTDITVRLTHVYPDGRSMLLGEAVQRLRFLTGFSRQNEAFLTPGNIYQVQLQLPDVLLSLDPDYRLRLIVSSSNYPRFHRNANTGADMYPNNSGTVLDAYVVAQTTILTGPNTASYVSVPISTSSNFTDAASSSRDMLTAKWAVLMAVVTSCLLVVLRH